MAPSLSIEPVYPALAEALLIHAGVMGTSATDAAKHGVRDSNLLESALQRPRNAAEYAGADLVDQAATLLWGLIHNHPFRDGNKRTAHAIALTFLEANGWTITASDDEMFSLLLEIAQGLSVDQVSEWIREHLAETE